MKSMYLNETEMTSFFQILQILKANFIKVANDIKKMINYISLKSLLNH